MPGDERDQRLLEEMLAGEPRALAETLELYWKPIVRYVTPIIGSVDGAEDIAQEAFVRFWERRRRWRPSGSIRAVLYRIARNLALNERRWRGVRARWVLRQRDGLATPGGFAAGPMEGHEVEAAVNRAIASLAPRRREVFVLVRFSYLSYRQVADVMGISEQTVANQMTAALADLRRSLRPYLDPAGE